MEEVVENLESRKEPEILYGICYITLGFRPRTLIVYCPLFIGSWKRYCYCGYYLTTYYFKYERYEISISLFLYLFITKEPEKFNNSSFLRMILEIFIFLLNKLQILDFYHDMRFFSSLYISLMERIQPGVVTCDVLFTLHLRLSLCFFFVWRWQTSKASRCDVWEFEGKSERGKGEGREAKEMPGRSPSPVSLSLSLSLSFSLVRRSLQRFVAKKASDARRMEIPEGEKRLRGSCA